MVLDFPEPERTIYLSNELKDCYFLLATSSHSNIGLSYCYSDELSFIAYSDKGFIRAYTSYEQIPDEVLLTYPIIIETNLKSFYEACIDQQSTLFSEKLVTQGLIIHVENQAIKMYIEDIKNIIN